MHALRRRYLAGLGVEERDWSRARSPQREACGKLANDGYLWSFLGGRVKNKYSHTFIVLDIITHFAV